MIYLKSSVNLLGISPQCVLAITIADQQYGSICQVNQMWVTSVVDSTHSAGSLHYAGFAFDLRISNVLSHLLESLRDGLKSALGPEFDVVLESDHVHIEFQPKRGVNK